MSKIELKSGCLRDNLDKMTALVESGPGEVMREPVPEVCRCGHAMHADGPHPCHGEEYTCRKPAKARFIAKPLGSYALAGMQMKMTGYLTFACDECWEKYVAERKAATEGNTP